MTHHKHEEEIDEQIKILEQHGFKIIARKVSVPTSILNESDICSNPKTKIGFIRNNKCWIKGELKNLIDDLEDEHYSDVEFFALWDTLKEKFKREQELWNKNDK